MQEQIPKIERSVAYTFDAYSGGLQLDIEGKFSNQKIDAYNALIKLCVCLIIEKGRKRLKNKNASAPSTYDYKSESESSNDAFAVFRNFSSESIRSKYRKTYFQIKYLTVCMKLFSYIFHLFVEFKKFKIQNPGLSAESNTADDRNYSTNPDENNDLNDVDDDGNIENERDLQ